MNKLFLIIALLLTGCSGATRVVSTTPKGKIPQADGTIQDIPNTLSNNGIWITVWLLTVGVAVYLTARVFREDNQSR